MNAEEATRALFGAWEQGDAGTVSQLFAEDGRYEDPLLPEPLQGRDAIRQGIAAAMAEVEGVRIEVKHLLAKGEAALCEASFSCQLRGGGGRLDFHFAMVVELCAGRIQRLSEYFDTRGLPG